MKLIYSLKKSKLSASMIYSAILVLNLSLIFITFVQKNSMNEITSAKMIKNYYLSDTIRNLCPDDIGKFNTSYGNLVKDKEYIIVKLKNGFERKYKY